ncbi:xanthine dehydrogenase family protein molybdopterin-binding subunit [Aurantimonas sp. VKM B-3413]|uniref:xanthine dehydrogenase family protein molybdopterin-binding subunit n=1 Tax=Aurantimonas sp. VKM B-3413 TaxID=2779401 RepID=UPI001E30138E|nr:xanthine dehydrogenase family protein molybdopterin-binding subunit [Aurantimonas sp. VKM B-3413]MCB8839675.1 xanthine dehydrogenase family protein molybdopterin-binding subunit [Aurantimonas sp. VKM B-3413]
MTAAVPESKKNMGQPVARIDARLKVTGEAHYAADEPVNNPTYGVLVTSPIARGRLKALHLDEARRVPGVLAIVSHGDMDGIDPPEFGNASYTSLGPLHRTEIFHDGQIIALVVADTFVAAHEAAFKVSADYDFDEPSASLDSQGVEVIEAKGNTKKFGEYPSTGDFDGAWDTAATKHEAEYRTPTQHHNPMELFSTTAVWNGEELTIYEPSQNVYGFRGALARQMHMDPAKIRVISRYIGGGFGSKGPMTPRTAIVALAARKLNRPVRCVVTRQQCFTTVPYRAPTRQTVRLGADAAGKLNAFSHEGWELTSRVDNYVVGGVETTARMYGYNNVSTKVSLVKADRQTPAYMRSPPELPYMFALETAMDEMAEKLGMDPVEFRRVNDTMTDPISGNRFSSRSLMQCFDQASEAFGWSQRTPEPGSMRDGDWLIGYGCATATYPTNVAASTARVKLYHDGRVRVQSASHEIGTGIRTVAGQMAAEQLGVGFDRVEVEMGDTDLPPAPVSGGSNSTASVCSTVMKACGQIRQKLFQAVVATEDGPLRGRDAGELSLKDGAIVATDGASVKLATVFDTLGQAAIEEYAEFIPDHVEPGAVRKLYDGQTTFAPSGKRNKAMYAFGAEFVEVRIHRRTREIRVPRMVGAFAAGHIMNPRTARSQLMGGLIWGMSSALLEATEVDERGARYVNRNIAEYLIPVNADIQDVEVILVPEVDEEVNSAGVKGLGELGNVGTAAAVSNAVYHATGIRVRELPIRLENLMPPA